MIPSLENLKELEILIRFDCSCPNMSEITLNIIIDEHSREFENSLKNWYVQWLDSDLIPGVLENFENSKISNNLGIRSEFYQYPTYMASVLGWILRNDPYKNLSNKPFRIEGRIYVL